MAIILRPEESVDSAIRRFKKEQIKAGTIQELRKREFYMSPSLKKRKKHEAALKRAKKNAPKQKLY